MEDGSRIVHHTVWVDGDREPLFLKAVSYAVGKTRTDEQQGFQRFDRERGWRYNYRGSKLHNNNSNL